MFLKTEKQNLCGNYFALCLYNRFKCYNLACVAFEYCASAFMCLYVFLFVEPGSKNGKSDGSYVN